MSKSSDGVKKWRTIQKIKLIEYKGGKCIICGYNKTEYLSVFDLHHRNPQEKSFSLSIGNRCISWEKIKKEADKCDLLCNRCHQELHDKQHWEKRKKILSIERKKITKIISCECCKKEFKQKRKEQKYCSVKCSRKGIKKIPEYDIELLKKEHKELGYKAVLEKYSLKRSSFYELIKCYSSVADG